MITHIKIETSDAERKRLGLHTNERYISRDSLKRLIKEHINHLIEHAPNEVNPEQVIVRQEQMDEHYRELLRDSLIKLQKAIRTANHTDLIKDNSLQSLGQSITEIYIANVLKQL